MSTTAQTPHEQSNAPQRGESVSNDAKIDLTPTWEQQLTVCLTIYENSNNAGARLLALGEMRKMARIADYYHGLVKSNRIENNFTG